MFTNTNTRMRSQTLNLTNMNESNIDDAKPRKNNQPKKELRILLLIVFLLQINTNLTSEMDTPQFQHRIMILKPNTDNKHKNKPNEAENGIYNVKCVKTTFTPSTPEITLIT